MKPTLRSLSALSVLALAIAGCAPQAAPGVPAPNTPPAQEAPAPQAPGYTDSGTPGTTPSADPAAPAAPRATATLRGKVYDEAGTPVDGGQVRIKSLDPAAPYDALVNLMQGSYVANQVPVGTLVEISATKEGWTKRARVTSLVGNNQDSSVDFGGNNAYFISDFPEIESVMPARDGVMAPGKIAYQLNLSEPLSENSKRRFENALRLIPANAAAAPGGTFHNAAANEDVYGVEQDITAASYAIKKGNTFMEDATRVAQVIWSADGRSASLEFDAPLAASSTDEALYQVALVSDGSKIEDASGKQLGTDSSGSLSAFPAAGKLILGAIKSEALALKTIAPLSGAAERWAATHDNVGKFKLAQDKAAPVLEGVSVVSLSNQTRIVLGFNKPMAAFNGSTTGYANAAALDLSKYTFAIGAKASDLTNVKLDGTAEATVNVGAGGVTTFGAASERATEFAFTNATLSVDPQNSKRMFLSIPHANFFHADNTALKVRVQGVMDPAGNAILGTDADKQIQNGSL